MGIYKSIMENNEYEKSIKPFRDELDGITKKLIDWVFERTSITDKIGMLKRKYNKPIYVPERETKIIEKIENLVEENNHKCNLNIDPKVPKKNNTSLN